MMRTPFVHIFILIAFLLNTFGYVPNIQAQEFKLPAPGVMVRLSPEFNPAHLRGMAIHKNDPFRLDFFVNKGEQALSEDQKKKQYQELIKYFMAALATPDEDQWVNLSPYEHKRIIADDFAKTTMGRDLLAEDYMLKQITASVIYPEDKLGKAFWAKVYAQAQKQFGTTNIPVNTFNKVWIVPEKAVVYENSKTGSVYIINSNLKVMLEEDYLSLSKHSAVSNADTQSGQVKDVNKLGSQIVREIVLPELTKEVNTGKNFAPLRQIYSAMILATWYKKALRKGILARIYTDKAKVKGIDQDPASNEIIYQRYLKAFKKGVYNYIKEDLDPATQEVIPRKYFSGGFSRMEATRNALEPAMSVLNDAAQLSTQTRNEFEEEGLLRQVDLVPVSLTPDFQGLTNQTPFFVPITVKTFRNKTFGSNALTARLRHVFTKAVLIGFMMTSLFVPSLKAISLEAQQFIAAQDQRDNIKAEVDSQSLDQGLNNIMRSFIRINGNQLIMKDHVVSVVGNNEYVYKNQMPYLSALIAKAGIESSDAPYNLLVKTVKERVDDLKQKLNTGTITSTQQDELDNISKEAILLIQNSFVGVPDDSQNRNPANYKSHQNNVQKLIQGINGNHQYNCEAISIATVFIAHEMGIDEVYLVNIEMNEDGTTFPDVNGIGHVANAFKDSRGVWTHFDQGGRSHPKRVEIYDRQTGRAVVIAGDQIAAYPNASPRSLSDLILDQKAYTLVDELFRLSTSIDNWTLNNKPDQVSQTLAKINEGMPWIEGHPIVVNRNYADLKKNLETIRSFINDTSRMVSAVKDDIQAGDVFKDYKASVARINIDIQRANDLFNLKHFSEAAEVYGQVARKANSELERFKGLKDRFPANLYTEDDGVKKPLTSSQLLDQLSQMASTSTANAKAAQNNAVMTKGENSVSPASDGQAQTNPSEGGLGAYQSLTEKINSLNTEAGIAFDDHNYKSAAEGFGAVIKLVNDNIDRMREQLKEAKGITDGAGNPLTGAQLIEKLTKSAGTAANNQNLAINKVMIEEYNTLVTDYKRFVDDKDPAVVKREMQSIVDKSIKALKTEGLKDKVKAEFEKLESAAQQRLKDSAMNTFNQPVGGIDFNSQNLDLQVTGDVGQMDMPIDSTAWDNVKIQGLVPAIIEIKPVSDWGVF